MVVRTGACELAQCVPEVVLHQLAIHDVHATPAGDSCIWGVVNTRSYFCGQQVMFSPYTSLKLVCKFHLGQQLCILSLLAYGFCYFLTQILRCLHNTRKPLFARVEGMHKLSRRKSTPVLLDLHCACVEKIEPLLRIPLLSQLARQSPRSHSSHCTLYNDYSCFIPLKMCANSVSPYTCLDLACGLLPFTKIEICLSGLFEKLRFQGGLCIRSQSSERGSHDDARYSRNVVPS
mmetsp:Transcript_29370/g.56376  ORF Transcript_29370/g.56376 Transcript_29370/m.56376 type:complete len:233 (+) Transcript_29370:612-1310(+)